MKKPPPFAVLIAAVAVAALLFRLPGLGRRPMHTDEAVQAVKSGDLLEGRGWRYDPREFHGPTLPYISLPFLWIAAGTDFAATSEQTFRVIPVLFGVGLVLLTCLAADGTGTRAAVVAAALCAVSPAMVYYSRYYIRETLLVFFTFGAIVSGWRYVRTSSTGWAVGTGAFLALMYATKETCIIAFFSMAVGIALTLAFDRWIERATAKTPRTTGPSPLPSLAPWRCKPLALAFGVALVIWFVLFSSFFTNMRGLLDSVRTYFLYAGRSLEGEIHAHPWYYYLRILTYAKLAPGPWWSEGLIVALSICGAAAALRRAQDGGTELVEGAAALRRRSAAGEGEKRIFDLPTGASVALARFLTFYTLTMTLVYAAIAYKTPWCMLSFLHGMILLAGIGAVVVVASAHRLAGRLGPPRRQGRQRRGRSFLASWRLPVRRLLRKGAAPAAAALLALGGLHLAAQARRATSRRFCAEWRNPYVYAHTVPDLVRLARRVEEIAEVSGQGRDMVVKVVAPDVWPLPWYFRGFSRVGYWTEIPPGFDPDAPVLVASPEYAQELAPKLKDKYQVGYHGLRPTVVLLLYVRQDLWDAFLDGRAGDG